MPLLEEEPVRQTAPRPADDNFLVDLENHPLEQTKPPLLRRRGVVIAAAVVAALAIIYVATIFFHNLTHESTDDAFIDAHVVSVAPKIAGKIAAVEVSDNELVKKGQVLLEIDPRDVDAEVARKRAALEVAKARLENAQMSAEQAEAHVRTLAAAYAAAEASTAAAAAETAKQRGDLARNSGLIASGAISKQDFQHSQSDTTSSEATLESKKKQLQAAAAYAEEGKKQAGSARAQVSAAKAEVTAAEAELHQAELQKSYTKIPAPEAGRVTNKSIEPGNYVQVGQPLFAIVPQHVWVTANFKETQLSEMRPGQPAEVEVDAYPGCNLRAHVDSIQAGSGAHFSLLPPENATGNFVKVVQRVPVKIALDEQPDVTQVLGPGMSAVPDVKVRSSLGPAIKVSVVAGIAILLLFGATFFWLRRIHPR
ncbi:MAG TPA: efflux RND transporter periplasmic adaptor subunit [Chthoniobacterales bacterium]|nr:efflux RND transporter periplasmic adaptor subunit [Chthoniobacterales bacterium]